MIKKEAAGVEWGPWTGERRDEVVAALGAPESLAISQNRSCFGADDVLAPFALPRVLRDVRTGEVVGVAAVHQWRGTSPNTYGYVEIVPAFRRRGIATVALAGLWELLPASVDKVMSHVGYGTAGHQFVLSRGFQGVGRSRGFVVPPSAPAVAPVGRYKVSVVDTRDAPEDVVRGRAVYLSQIAGERHPPCLTPAELEQHRLYYFDDNDAPCVMVRRLDGTLAGFGLVDDPFFSCGDPLDVLGGPADLSDPDSTGITSALLRGCLDHLPSHELVLELNDHNGAMVPVVESLACRVEGDLVTAVGHRPHML